MAYDWRRLDIETSPFVLTAYLPRQSSPDHFGADKALTVYIEGDGLAWITRSRPSPDPTPVAPIGLELAFSHSDLLVAYLARPCQYTMMGDNAVCGQKYWTTHRFAPEVIAAASHAIDILKKETGAAKIQLAGYSGGGAIAALVAAQRDDVVGLRTVAGNLDHALWTERHFIDPLNGSLNPVDVATRISHLPQLHFVGTEDKVIPRDIAESFITKQGAAKCSEIVSVKDVDHSHGWVEHWPELLSHPLPCH